MKISLRAILIGTAGVLVAGSMAGIALTNSFWVPKLDSMFNQIFGLETEAKTQQLQTQGAENTTKDVEKHNELVGNVKGKVEYVTRTIRASPDAKTPLPRDSVARLRAADEQLCQFGVRCVEERRDPEAAPSSTPGDSPPPVRALRSAKDAGDTDLSGS